MTTPNKTGDIYLRLAAIMSDIAAIEKNQENEAQKFQFRGIDDILNELHPIFKAHGVMCLPFVKNAEHKDAGLTKNNNVITRAIVTMGYRFTTTDGSFTEAEMVGEGMDSGDKSTAKALSVALKYLLMQTFLIPTKDVVESDYYSPTVDAREELAVKNRDLKAIDAIIAQHEEDARNATGQRRQELLGLASDMRVKRAEVTGNPDPIPNATPVESVPLPAQEVAPAGDWREVVNTTCGFVGKSSGKLLNMKVGEIFTPERSQSFVDATMKFFTSQLGNKTALPPKDAALWRAIQQGHKAWEEAQKAEKPSEAANTPETPQEPAQPDTEAPVTGWRAHEIKIKHPDWAGKLLGSFDIKEIQRIQAEYLDQVPDQNALTLPQKSLKANLALALAELLPPAAKPVEETPFEVLPPEEPDHTTQLKDAIEGQKLNRNDFMAVCRKNDWISKDAKRIEDITLEEYNALSAEWSEVTKAVLANGV